MHKIQRRAYTDHISRHTAENICHAFDYAKYIGKPLNFYVVINFRDLSDGKSPVGAFEAIRHKCRCWLSYKKKNGQPSTKPVYVYSHENPNGMPHVNWVLHIPHGLEDEFRAKLDQWLAKVLGGIGHYDLDIQIVDPNTDKVLAKYVIKGTDTAYVPYLHLQQVASPQGRVWGRRATTSPSISRSARKKASFIPKRDRHKWKQGAR